jgi:hypothetical protein
MGAASKRAKKVRVAEDFDLLKLAAEKLPPMQTIGQTSWEFDDIRSAVIAQLSGQFSQSVDLGNNLKRDAALFTALLNRLAPHRGLPIELRSASTTSRASRIRDEAEALYGKNGIAIHPDTIGDLNEQLANHGVAIAYNVWTPRLDGLRVDVEVKAWPLRWVRWMPVKRCYVTQTAAGELVDIQHGDGKWIVIQQHQVEPWTWGSIIPAGLIWYDRAFGIRDRSKTSTSIGNAKMVGEMPEGVALQKKGSTELTPEARAFLDMLKALYAGHTAGLRPSGAKTEILSNPSTAWQIFNDIIKGNDVDASRIYLGSDGTTKDAGGNYIKSLFLFGVRNDIVEGDLRALERGLRTGSIEPWTAINFGDSTLAPERVWLMPDADEDARRASRAEQDIAFNATVKAYKDNGFDIEAAGFLEGLAQTYGVTAPALKPKAAPVAMPQSQDATPAAPTPLARRSA